MTTLPSTPGILEKRTTKNPLVDLNFEPPDDPLYSRDRDKKITELIAKICGRTCKDKWLRMCRIFLGLTEEDIDHVKKHYVGEDEMYRSIKNYQKFQDLFDQYKIELPESGSVAKPIYDLIDHVPLKERYNFVRHTLGNEKINPIQLHDGKFSREVMKAMLEYWCEKENATVDSLQDVLNVGEKKGYLEPKKNATQKLMANAEGKEQSEGEVFLKPKAMSDCRLKDVFQDETIKAFLGIAEFKMFARLWLCLEEQDIQDIVRNNKNNVKEQKLEILNKWKENNGKQATIFYIRKLVASYQERDEDISKCEGSEANMPGYQKSRNNL